MIDFEDMEIDFKRLRKDMTNEILAAYFGGGIGPAFAESFEIERMDSEELVNLAYRIGIDLRKYLID